MLLVSTSTPLAAQENPSNASDGLSLGAKHRLAHEFLQELVLKTRALSASFRQGQIRQMHENALRAVESNRLLDAARLYEEIVLLDPDDDEAYLIMGHSYLLSGNTAKAADAFQNAIHIDPENAREIIPFYENLVLKNVDDDSAHAELGYAWLILGDPEKAQEAFREALAINPYNAMALEGSTILGGSGS